MAYFSGANSGCVRGAEQMLFACIKDEPSSGKAIIPPSDILIST
jgi:hypothetical protein